MRIKVSTAAHMASGAGSNKARAKSASPIGSARATHDFCKNFGKRNSRMALEVDLGARHLASPLINKIAHKISAATTAGVPNTLACYPPGSRPIDSSDSYSLCCSGNIRCGSDHLGWSRSHNQGVRQ